MTNETDPALIARMYAFEDGFKLPSKLIIENDNNFFTTFTHLASFLRDPEATEPLYEDSVRLASFDNTELRLEPKLSAGRHRILWENNRFELEMTVEDSKETVTVYLPDAESSAAFQQLALHMREYTRCKSRSERDQIVVKTLGPRGLVWRQSTVYAKRSIDSIVTENNAPQELINDMEKFRASEKDYAKYGLPYKRVYMIAGPPGCGKSTLVTVAASHFDVDICYLTVVPGQTDKDLSQALSTMPDRSILVLEDIDLLVANAATTGHNNAQTTISVLTSILDGTLFKKGLMTFLTTTTPDAHDAVFTRAGRVDHTTELMPITEKQTSNLVKHVFQDQGVEETVLKGLTNRICEQIACAGDVVTSAMVVHFLFRHRDRDPASITDKVCAELRQDGLRLKQQTSRKPNLYI